MEKISRKFSGVLKSDIPYLSMIEQMGVYREPVGAFSPGSRHPPKHINGCGKIYKKTY